MLTCSTVVPSFLVAFAYENPSYMSIYRLLVCTKDTRYQTFFVGPGCSVYNCPEWRYLGETNFCPHLSGCVGQATFLTAAAGGDHARIHLLGSMMPQVKYKQLNIRKLNITPPQQQSPGGQVWTVSWCHSSVCSTAQAYAVYHSCYWQPT